MNLKHSGQVNLNRAQESSPSFDFGQIRMMFAHNDSNLRLNKIAEHLDGISVNLNDKTWVSSFKRSQDGLVITVGTEHLPEDVNALFEWGAKNKEEMLILKIAHELSHGLQKLKGLEEELIKFGNGSNNTSEKALEYLQLYEMLGSVPRLTGLSKMGIYHDQTITERERVGGTSFAVDMQILEDVTELIAAYSLGDSYFNFRLDRSNLSQYEKEEIARYVIAIFQKNIPNEKNI